MSLFFKNTKTTRHLVIGLTVAALCAAAGGWYFYLNPIETVKQRVKNTLKDPDSAIFQNVLFYRKTSIGCGSVNAKNSMGGYNGYFRFIAFPDGDIRFEPRWTNINDNPEATSEVKQINTNFHILFAANCPQ